MDAMLRAYKAFESMEPIALLDYYVRIRTYNDMAGKFYKVAYYEAIPPFQAADLGATAAGVAGTKTAITNLDLWDEEFGQWRFFPLDNFQVALFNPAGVSKWQLKNITVQIDKSIIIRNPSLNFTEFCTWEDERPSMQATNFSDIALLATRVICMGYRYHVNEVSSVEKKQLEEGHLPFTPVQCSGMAGAGR